MQVAESAESAERLPGEKGWRRRGRGDEGAVRVGKGYYGRNICECHNSAAVLISAG